MAAFSHISGDRMLDLVNTVEWRLGGPAREEDLTSCDRVLTWCRESGLLDATEQEQLRVLAGEDPCTAAAELDRVVALRERLYEALFHGDEHAAEAIATAFRDTLGHSHLSRRGAGWCWSDNELTLATVRHRITRGLVELMNRDDLDRLHQCEDATCGWVYLDTSPGGTAAGASREIAGTGTAPAPTTRGSRNGSEPPGPGTGAHSAAARATLARRGTTPARRAHAGLVSQGKGTGRPDPARARRRPTPSPPAA